MARPPIRRSLILLTILAIAALPAAGCQSVMLTAMYLIKGTDVDPEYKGLKGKKVAVVCRPLVSLQYRNANVGRDLAEKITRLLQAKVPKIKTVDQQTVAQWLDENTWDEYVEVGKALDVDAIVGIDLEGFDIFQGQTLYQGKANAAIQVVDCRDGGKVVFEKTLPQSVYPPNIGIPASERTEGGFRAEFVTVLADQIARHFYAHDPHADMALDAKALD
ncbi:MAG: hypothetical protein JW959_08110 [Pirellulales bacterium]|nr:hypothetical protein [Pirellulales bacterium]